MKKWIILNKKNCDICNKIYEYDSRQKKSKYCSQSCRSLSFSQTKIVGEEGIDYVICKVCGFKFREINNDHVKKHNMTCEDYDIKFESSRTSEKTKNKKDTLSLLMGDEMSKKLSKSHTIEGYINKYGHDLGMENFYKMKENKKYKNSKESYIDKYGYIIGLEVFNSIQKKKSITLENCVNKHGEVDGRKLYDKWLNVQKNKNFLSFYIERYGYDLGLVKWLDKNNKISLSNSKIKKEDVDKFKYYVCEVNKYTRLSLCKNIIDDIELRGKEFGYDLDHTFSKVDGFRNGIPPYIIGHISNLKIIESGYNRKKQHKSNIEIENIIHEYENDIEYRKIVNDIERIKNYG
jgi:hypothetical protein